MSGTFPWSPAGPAGLPIGNATAPVASGSGGGGGGGVTPAPANEAYVIIGSSGSLPGARTLTAGVGIMVSDGGAGGQVIISGTGGTGANPTATAGPVAVNGSATTFLRSDGAPAVQLGSASQKGIVQVDGTTIVASSGVISAVAALPSLTNGDIWVGNGSNVATAVVPSGDVTMSDAGVFTIKSSVALAGSPTTTTQAPGTNNTTIATTSYVDSATAGINPAVAVQAATTAAADTSAFTYNNGAGGIGATFTGVANTPFAPDGFTFTALGQRALIKNDTQSPSGAFNGVWYVTQLQTALLPPILTRALDYDQPSDINNTGIIPVINGTVNGTTTWVLTSSVNTVGTDPLTYVEFSKNPTTPYIVSLALLGAPLANSQATYVLFEHVITFPANFGAISTGQSSGATGTANAAGSTAFSIDKRSANPGTFGTNVGTITIGAGGITATLATVGGTSYTTAAGELWRIIGPASADATFANLIATLVGTR